MTTLSLPRAGELWRSDASANLMVRVLAVALADPQPAVDCEILDEEGSALSGPVRVRFDADWNLGFSRCDGRNGLGGPDGPAV